MTQPSTLSHEQLMRYSRHIMLPSMDLDGQEKLVASRVLVIGVGGLGCAVSPYLAASGVGSLTLVDDDLVESTNLQRQILHTEDKLGMNKAASAAQAIYSINSSVKVNVIEKRLDDDALQMQIQQHDLVIDCCDNLKTREQINRLCFVNKKFLVSGAAIRMEGQVATFTMEQEHACYACLSQTFGEQSLSCSEAGILSPVVGIVGCIQATEAIKVLTGIGDTQPGTLLMIDAATMQFTRFNVPKRENCNVCGN